MAIGRLGRLGAVVVFVGGPCLSLPARASEYPTELQVAVEEANEAFFDGKYEESLRLTDKAIEFFKDKEYQKLLVDRRLDWQLHLNFMLGLQAEVLVAEGEYSAASTKLKSAMQKLRQRRGYYTKRRWPPEFLNYLWLNDAFLCFVEGDLHRPCIDFSAAMRLSRASQDLAADLCNPKKSESCYARGVQALDKIHLTVQPGQEVFEGLEMARVRSKIRAYVSLARTELAGESLPSAEETNDAISFLVRAAELQACNGWWRLFGAPDAAFPDIGYHRLQALSEEKAKMNTSGGVALSEREIILIKQRFMHAICDWLLIMFTRAEADAYMEVQGLPPSSQRGGWARDSAERYFQRAVHLLRSHFRGTHPMLAKAEFSKAAWFAIGSDPGAIRGAPSQMQVMRRATMARDAVFIAHKLRLDGGEGMPPKVRVDCNFLELRALQNLVGLHAVMPILDATQGKEIELRIATLEAELGPLAQDIKGSVPTKAEDDDNGGEEESSVAGES